MVTRVDTKKPLSGIFLWCLIGLLTASSIAGWLLFVNNYSSVLRLIYWILSSIALVFLLLQTEAGKSFSVFWQAATLELRKVVWPNRQETINTTLVVLGMILAMGCLMWFLDALLVRMMGWLLHG